MTTPTDDAPPPPSGRSRASKTGDRVKLQAHVPPWVCDAIDDAAAAERISRSAWVARELEVIASKLRGR